MGIGSAFGSGYRQTRKQQRSFMPAVNTLTNIIANRRRRYGGGRRYDNAPQGPSSEERSDAFFNRDKADKERIWAESQLQQQQQRDAEKQARDTTLLQAEEARRQEAHEAEMAQKEQALGQQGETFKRLTDKDDRKQAYEMAKQGLMMRDAKSLNAALQQLAPGPGEDVITEGEPVDMEPGPGGVTMPARSFKGQPAPTETPQFIFDPDSEHVGVIFPGQQKPTVFKNVEQAFQNVLAPINPKNEKTKDEIAAAKNKGELAFKNKKLRADVYDKAHEAAMKQFYSDGYYEPSMYDEEKYQQKKKDYIANAMGIEPAEVDLSDTPSVDPATGEQTGGEAPGQQAPTQPTAARAPQTAKRQTGKKKYMGKTAPKGYPNAQQGVDGGWYIKKGNGWAAIVEPGSKKTEKKKSVNRYKPKEKKKTEQREKPLVVRKKMPVRPRAEESTEPAVVKKKITGQPADIEPTVVKKKITGQPEDVKPTVVKKKITGQPVDSEPTDMKVSGKDIVVKNNSYLIEDDGEYRELTADELQELKQEIRKSKGKGIKKSATVIRKKMPKS